MWPEVKTVKDENRRELKLSGSKVSTRIEEDGLDECIFELEALNYLNISDSSLNNVPDKISNLKHLQSLILFGNKISNVSQNIGELNTLKLLDISNNMLTEVPIQLNNLQNLTSLNLCNNKIKMFDAQALKKLSHLDLSHNELEEFPVVDCKTNIMLMELHLKNNKIVEITEDIINLPSLKLLDVSSNCIKLIPISVAKMPKLKDLNLKSNPLNDKRLLKLVEQARTKPVLDYVKLHGAAVKPVVKKAALPSSSTTENEEVVAEVVAEEEIKKKQSIVIVKSADDAKKVYVADGVKTIRPFLLCCIIRNLAITDLKTFLKIQNNLHDTICNKREAATIATHDLKKIVGDIKYDAKSPTDISISPLGSSKKIKAAKYYANLKHTADIIRKEKKRNTYSGIHKFLNLLVGNETFAYFEDEEKVISLPPLTNCDETKVTEDTTDVFVEVSSNFTFDACKVTMNALIKEILLMDVTSQTSVPLNKSKNNKEPDVIYDKYNEILIEQVKTYEMCGSVRSVFPGKGDLYYTEAQNIAVIYK